MHDSIPLSSLNKVSGPPKPEDVTLKFSDEAVKQLAEIVSHYPNEKAAILPALWIAQREYGGHLPPEAIAEVAVRLHRAIAEIEGVATFYTMYNTVHTPGKHKLEVCTCLSCHMNGAYRILYLIEKKLGIAPGETTADGQFTLEEVECLNACDRAPVMQVGDSYYGPVNEKSLDELIKNLKSTEESTVVQMADEIVKVHLLGQTSSK